MTIVSSELITVAQVTKEFGVYRTKKKRKDWGVCANTSIYGQRQANRGKCHTDI